VVETIDIDLPRPRRRGDHAVADLAARALRALGVDA